MSIVDSWIISDWPRKNGMRYVKYGFEDHNGKKYRAGQQLVPANFDVIQGLADYITVQESFLKNVEAETYIKKLGHGDTVVLIGDHQSNDE